MKDLPILFSAPMVRALLAGTKTQTRRVAKFVPLEEGLNFAFTGLRAAQDRPGLWTLQSRDGSTNLNDRTKPLRCPYGQPGERLWVRETFFAFGRWETRFSEKKGRDEWHFIDMTVECGNWYFYDATSKPERVANFRRGSGVTLMWWKRPAIFMPRWASRILLGVTEVRVQRLQEISAVDSLAEGSPREAGCNPQVWYRGLWDTINADNPIARWDANPWIWAISFRRIEPVEA
jgi:hypothetical protein